VQHRIALGQVPAQQRGQVAEGDLVVVRREVAAAERQLEVELGQPVGGRDVDQRPPAGQRAQVAGADRDERVGELGRVIQEHIKKPLAEEVLFGKLKKGGTVRVTVEQKETGETGLKLETIADEVPVKPKKEEEKRPATRRPAAKKAAKKAVASKPKSGGKDGGAKRSLVPLLPRKN